jgi:hypothetical protein
MTIRDWFRNRGFNVKDQTAGSSSGMDVVIHHEGNVIEVECKNKVVGVDYIEIKLDYVDGIWQCSNKLIQDFLNDKTLFNDENPLINKFSSVEWNEYKQDHPHFKDVHYQLGSIELSDYISADYIFFSDIGLYYLKHDILQLDVPKFICNNFEYRFYFKNHSSSRAVRANISCVVTLRVRTDKGMRISNIRIR